VPISPFVPGRLAAPLVAAPLLALLGVGAPAAPAAAPVVPRLRSCSDPSLQAGLEGVVSRLGLDQAVEGRRLAVAVVDLSGGGAPRLAMLNGDQMMYAASLPKIAILLGAFVQAERGNLTLDEPTLASLNRMIRHSSNAAANAMLAKVGEEALLDILTSPRYRFYDPATGGGLWVGKPYGKAPAYRRDPMGRLSHAATAFQVARFYYLLDRGALVNPELTRLMESALADPALHHKFVKGLESRTDARLYRKSGTWRQFHSDSVLVVGQRRRYILAALAEDSRGGEWLERMAAPLDALLARRFPEGVPLTPWVPSLEPGAGALEEGEGTRLP
jgi:beta-lactamase class A